MLPEPHSAVAAAAADEDNWSWLVTFSDLVLQLFGFAIIAAFAGAAAQRATPAAAPPATLAPAAEIPAAALPAEVTAIEQPALAVTSVPGGDLDSLPRSSAELADAIPVPPPARERATVPAAATAAPDVRMAALGRYLEHVVATQHELAASVRASDGAVVVQVGDVAGFAAGSAEPAPAMRPLLAELRALITASSDLQVVVSGHTDDVPIKTVLFPSNLELSLARASRVAHELAGTDAALWARISAAGYGEQRPLASNGDAQGRARNRRVEIRLTRAG